MGPHHPHEDGSADGVGADLQEAHLPQAVAVLPDLAVAARYVVAEAADGAGGGWLDVLTTPDGRVALVVGDVPGRDLAAITVMAQLRAATAAALQAGCSPAEALTSLDRFAATLPGAGGSSACVVVVDRATGDLRWAAAGHPGPVLVAGGPGRRLAGHLPGDRHGPLGCAEAYGEESARLPADTVLLLTTGGVEAAAPTTAVTGSAAEGPVAAAAVAAAADPRGALEALLNRVLDRLVTAGTLAEDLALVGVARTAGPPDLEVVAPATPAAVRLLRERFATWSAPLAPTRWDDSVLRLTVTELVTNAVEHGSPAAAGPDGAVGADGLDGLDGGAGEVELRAGLADDGALELSVLDRGCWQPPRRGGRGLPTVRGLVDELAVARGAAASPGTRVDVRHRLCHEVPVYRAEVAPSDGGDAPLRSRWDDGGVLHVAGAVDGLAADDLRSLLLGATCGGVNDVTVDLSGVSLLGRRGLQVLAEARGWREADGGALHLRSDPGSPAARAFDAGGMALG